MTDITDDVIKRLVEAMNFGQFSEDFDRPLVHSIRRDVKRLIVWAQEQRERQAVAVTDGWKLVPASPTDEMMAAYYEAQSGGHLSEWGYHAMLAAAPPADTVTPKLHAASYEHNGKQYAITLEGSHEEVHAHAMRLGFTVDGVIVHQEVMTIDVP